MGLSEVINSHRVDFNMIDPVALASILPSLRHYDIEQVMCLTRSWGRLHGINKLIQVISGKVKWPELYAALKKENLLDLAKMLKDEYYRQNPSAQPIHEDENLNPGVDQCGQRGHDLTGSNVGSDTVCSETSSRATTTVSIDGIVNSGASVIIHAQTVNFQYGNNNCMTTTTNVNTISNVEHDGTATERECEEQYDVCVENDVCESLEKNESEENMLVHSRDSGFPTEQAVPQSVSAQCSSSSSDSQDGSSPNVHSPNETADRTSPTLVSQERNCDEMVNSSPSDNISSRDNTNTMSESHGLNEIADTKIQTELGITLRNRVKRCGSDDEDETELKKLA